MEYRYPKITPHIHVYSTIRLITSREDQSTNNKNPAKLKNNKFPELFLNKNTKIQENTAE